MSWSVRDKQSRCYNCQSRGTSHMAGNCPRVSVCPRCSGAHSLKDCKATAAELKCPACSLRHPVWSEKCPVTLRRVIAESERIGVPYPPFWAGVRLSSLRPRCVPISSQYSAQVTKATGTFAQRVGGGGFPSVPTSESLGHLTQSENLRDSGGSKWNMCGSSYKDGGMADKPAKHEISEKRIEDNVSHKVVKQGISLFRRFLKAFVAEVDKQKQVRSREAKPQPGKHEDIASDVSDSKEASEDILVEQSTDDPKKMSEIESFDAQSLLQSTTNSTLNLVDVLMRSLLKILGPETLDEDDDELEDGEISELISQLNL